MEVGATERQNMSDSRLHEARILIVDDYEPNVIALERLLEVADFTNVVSTTDSSQVVSLCFEEEPDLIVLDLHMPAPDGFEVLAMLAPWIRGSTRLPVIVVTGDTETEIKRRALAGGASDFLSKPFDPSEVVLRCCNLIETRLLQLELHDRGKTLQGRVHERTRELDEARIEIVERLAYAAEYRDDMSGDHPERVGRLSAALARALGLPETTVGLIGPAATLHDVGKLAISDAILLKQGALTPMEFEVMKLHVSIGSEILGRSRSPLLQLSDEIALTHHERWDGSGYLEGLSGEGIPISGRIVAVADVYDTLTHRRPYKEPWPPEEALAEVRRSSGRQFDPRVVEAFLSLDLEREVSGFALGAAPSR